MASTPRVGKPYDKKKSSKPPRLTTSMASAIGILIPLVNDFATVADTELIATAAVDEARWMATIQRLWECKDVEFIKGAGSISVVKGTPEALKFEVLLASEVVTDPPPSMRIRHESVRVDTKEVVDSWRGVGHQRMLQTIAFGIGGTPVTTAFRSVCAGMFLQHAPSGTRVGPLEVIERVTFIPRTTGFSIRCVRSRYGSDFDAALKCTPTHSVVVTMYRCEKTTQAAVADPGKAALNMLYKLLRVAFGVVPERADAHFHPP